MKPETFKKLYFFRWGTEVKYRELKEWGMEYFKGIRGQGVMCHETIEKGKKKRS